jgi:hypothetical protein
MLVEMQVPSGVLVCCSVMNKKTPSCNMRIIGSFDGE